MKPRAVGVHVFAGGFALGVESAGFDVVGKLEGCNVGAKTWHRNRATVPAVMDRARKWTSALDRLRADGGASFVFGNPPCRAFSQSSHGAAKRGAASDDAWWARDVVTVGAALGADVVAIESVRGALDAAGSVHTVIREEFASTYPGEMWVLVNTYDHGLPQWRPRLFWVLAREVFGWHTPKPSTPRDLLTTIAGTTGLPNTEDLWSTINCAVRHRELLRKLMPTLTPGQVVTRMRPDQIAMAPEFDAYVRGRKSAQHFIRRLDASRPSPVVFGAQAKFVHPVEDRLLTMRELSRLCGFPDDWRWEGSLTTQLSDLGKGVCPPVAAWLSSEIAAYLDGQRPQRGSGSVTVDASVALKPPGGGVASPRSRESSRQATLW